jgi:hypothetical protein
MQNKVIVLLTSLILIFCQGLSITAPAYSVEFGQDATGDPNAVKVGGASGFLYSDRIVFTAAHVIDSTGGVDYWEKEGVIYTPGIVSVVGQKRYKAKKVLVAPTYRPRVGNDQTRVDDFAIIILQESIPMMNEVLVASTEEIDAFINDKTPVSMIGYGLQNPLQRTNSDWRNRSPMKMTSFLVSNEDLRNFYTVNANKIYQKSNQTMLDYGIPNTEQHGSVCDGDSGAGFFVDNGNIRYYLGPVGGQQAGIPNCRNDGSQSFGIGGGMTGITASNKFSTLIKEAEQIIAEDKQNEFLKAEEIRIAAELKAKQEAEAKARAEAEAKAKAEAEAKAKAEEEARVKAEAELKAKQESEVKAAAEKKKITITCVKGKLTKKVTAAKPKCPVGYKKK